MKKIYNIPDDIMKINICLLSAFNLAMQEQKKSGVNDPSLISIHNNILTVLKHFEILTDTKMPANHMELSIFNLTGELPGT